MLENISEADVEVINLGSVTGGSVLELIITSVIVTGVDVPFQIVGRR